REWIAAERDHCAIRQRIELAPVRPLDLADQSLGVENVIHGARGCALGLGRKQQGKPFGILAPAFEARPMPCGKGRDLVEKEQFRVVAPPYAALAALETEHAAN